MNNQVQAILSRHPSDRSRLLDILWDIQHHYGYIPDSALPPLAMALALSINDIRETISFYHFFHTVPAGTYRIYLSDTVIAGINGYDGIYQALRRETGCDFAQVDDSGRFGLYRTSCIGLSDQEPAILINQVAFTRLTPDKVVRIVQSLKQGQTPDQIANPNGLRTDDIAYIEQLVPTQIHQRGPVFFHEPIDYRALLTKVVAAGPQALIETISEARLRGRGGAGFATGLKWRLCRQAEGEFKVVICNADEGEPGTFKDRVLLTQSPRDVLMGMVLAAYGIGASEGIVYLRAEYGYLKNYLERQLADLRSEGLLGRDIIGSGSTGHGFDFDIRIQLGAGAYVCGDESALIESCEGKRGTPRLKPPYPVQQGYLGQPTCVNNVETLAAVPRIVQKGAQWYQRMGTEQSAGTRLLSVSGDCDYPGIYEVQWGISLNQVLKDVGARSAWAVQVSGPSGECVSVEKEGQRRLGHEDLNCNGSLMIFNRQRDLLAIVKHFTAFFADESCGICVPCRAGNVELLHKMQRVIDAGAVQQDLDQMRSWCDIIRSTSRCGLGATSPNPILTTLAKFPDIYGQKLQTPGILLPAFDSDAVLMANRDYYHELKQKHHELKQKDRP